MKLKLIFAWYDLWVGLFYDRNKNWLYILPIPMLGIIVKFPQKRYWLVSKRIKEENGEYAVFGSTTPDEVDYYMYQDDCNSRPYWAWNGTTNPIFGKNYNDE